MENEVILKSIAIIIILVIIICILKFLSYLNNKVYVNEEMVYGLRKKYRLIAYGVYKDKYEWCVLNLESYPACYVKLPEDHIYYGIREGTGNSLPINCHGGITYDAHFLYLTDYFNGEPQIRREGHWIGWDYGHNGDFRYIERTGHTFPSIDENVYTTDILIRDCVNVCKQLVDLDKK